MKKLKEKINNSLLIKNRNLKKRIKYLEKELTEQVVEKRELIDEIEPLRIKVRELSLQVEK